MKYLCAVWLACVIWGCASNREVSTITSVINYEVVGLVTANGDGAMFVAVPSDSILPLLQYSVHISLGVCIVPLDSMPYVIEKTVYFVDINSLAFAPPYLRQMFRPVELVPILVVGNHGAFLTGANLETISMFQKAGLSESIGVSFYHYKHWYRNIPMRAVYVNR